MSWYIRNLIQNSDLIRASIYNEYEVSSNLFFDSPDELVEFTLRMDINFEDDQYSDLLIVEKKIKELYESQVLAKKELDILIGVSDGKSLIDLEGIVGMNRNTIAKILNSTCEKIAFILGGDFTDYGYLERMTQKYNLNEEQVKNLKEYMGI